MNTEKITSKLICLFGGCLLAFFSCNQRMEDRRDNLNFIAAKSFLTYLSKGEFDSALGRMDSYFIERANKKKLSTSIQELSGKIISDYGKAPKVSFISSEKTLHEGFAANFLICKIESKQQFGYYFFYTNDQTNKILLVSEFAAVKEKR